MANFFLQLFSTRSVEKTSDASGLDLISVFFAQQVHLETESDVGVFEIFQACLQPQMTPKQSVNTHQKFIAGIFDDCPCLREEGRTERHTTYDSVPFGVVASEEMPVCHGDTQLVATEIEVLGGSNVVVEEVKLDIGAFFDENLGTEIVGS